MPRPDPARTEILARIEKALGPDRDAVTVPRDYRHEGDLPPVDVLALFCDRLADYGVTVTACEEAGLPATIAARLAARDARRVAVPPAFPAPSPAPPAAGLPEFVVDHGQLSWSELDVIDGALTACAVAIAETGTLVLDGSPDQGRRAMSLLPDYHLCVVRAGQVVQSVPEALRRLDPARPLTFISGPSATSDIELERVPGVHGPRTLDVILAEP
jgi:L-lactate dehydrogenase complex protein LldG